MRKINVIIWGNGARPAPGSFMSPLHVIPRARLLCRAFMTSGVLTTQITQDPCYVLTNFQKIYYVCFYENIKGHIGFISAYVESFRSTKKRKREREESLLLLKDIGLSIFKTAKNVHFFQDSYNSLFNFLY